MNLPNLNALCQGKPDAWDNAFDWLWPTAFAVAKLKLEPFLPGEIEDVAIEALEELVEKVKAVKQVEELKPLAASIAHHRAVSRLRVQFAQKRGAGQTESLEALQNNEGRSPDPSTDHSPLDELSQTELATLLEELQAEVKPEYRAVMQDFFLQGLSYEQIASKNGMAMGTVGVYLKRGLDAVRQVTKRQPRLLKELEAFLR